MTKPKRQSRCVYFALFMLLWQFLNCALWTGSLFAFNLGYFFHNVWTVSGHLPLEIVAICTSWWDGLFLLCVLPARLAFAMPMLPSGLLLMVLAALASGSTGGGMHLSLYIGWALLESSPLFHCFWGSGLPKIYLETSYFNIAFLPS